LVDRILGGRGHEFFYLVHFTRQLRTHPLYTRRRDQYIVLDADTNVLVFLEHRFYLGDKSLVLGRIRQVVESVGTDIDPRLERKDHAWGKSAGDAYVMNVHAYPVTETVHVIGSVLVRVLVGDQSQFEKAILDNVGRGLA